ncbi:hypothetical protein, partial [Mesorhizobium sp.]|uniref:hypothetical protein n=1 Tax=Mesorhizobium sp. TaxID=1871066 RepID=UPI00257D444F
MANTCCAKVRASILYPRENGGGVLGRVRPPTGRRNEHNWVIVGPVGRAKENRSAQQGKKNRQADAPGKAVQPIAESYQYQCSRCGRAHRAHQGGRRDGRNRKSREKKNEES